MITPNENDLNTNNIIEYIPRCPNCSIIPALKLTYNEGSPMITYQCENQHKGEISLEEYMKTYNKYSITKQNCDECNKSQNEIKANYSYCSKCNKFLCNICLDKHDNDGDKHQLTNLYRYDSLCKVHSNLYSFFCIKCKKNICVYCKPNHEFHDLIDLSKFVYSDEEKNKINEEIKKMEQKIQNLDVIKQEICKKIDDLKKSSELEMRFMKLLLLSYNYEEKQKNLNLNVIQNLKNFEKIFKSNKIDIYDKIYKESKKYISIFDKFKNYQSNSFTNNFKTLQNHTNSIYHLAKLKDGRLASCSNDYCLNIYKNNTFELQLTIKEHTSGIASFAQINDGRIITCSWDKTMKIIKLLDENKYKIDQELKDHTECVDKIIENKENILISISEDKTMKIWQINNENKFYCVKSINFQNNNSACNILKLNDDEFVTSSCSDKCIKFWNSDDYSLISEINNIETTFSLKNLCLLEDDILCVGGTNSKGFYLVKISTHQIIKNILGPKTIYSINECIDGLFLCSIIDDKGNHNLVKYKYDNLNLVKVAEKIKAHSSYIYSCVELNNGEIASGGSGDNYSIKLWSN